MILSILTVADEKLSLKISEDRVLRLHGPNKSIANSILELRKLDDDLPHDAAVGVLNQLIKKILDNNDESLEFTAESVYSLPEDTKVELLNGYIAFAKNTCKGIVVLQSVKGGS
jgi:hypothetical protein